MTASSSHLIAPHGGELVNLVASPDRSAELKAQSREWPSWDLTARQICDLELLLNGGFSPLRGFMTKADYEGVGRIIYACQRAGIVKVGFITEPPVRG